MGSEPHLNFVTLRGDRKTRVGPYAFIGIRQGMPKDDRRRQKQMNPDAARDYDRVERAIEYLVFHRESQSNLENFADHIGLSPFYMQRLFTRWANVSPKRFLSYGTVEHAEQLLEESASVLDAAYDAGLSWSSRLRDLMVSAEAKTPCEYKARGAEPAIR